MIDSQALYPQEIIQLQEKGEALAVRPMEPQPTWNPGPDPGNQPGHYEFHRVPNPFGPVGSEFWIQEEWANSPVKVGGYPLFRYKADGKQYVASIDWKPADTMPQWASRYTAIHEGTTCKRVQDVTEEEALQLGIFKWPLGYGYYTDRTKAETVSFDRWQSAFVSMYESIWQSRHPDFPWQDNPWVWLGKLKLKGE